MDTLNRVLHSLQEGAKLYKIFEIGTIITANDDEKILDFFKLKDDMNPKECSSLNDYDEMLKKKKKLLLGLKKILIMQQKLLLQGEDVELYGLIKKATSLNGYGTSCYISSSIRLLEMKLAQTDVKKQIKESVDFFKWVLHSPKNEIIVFSTKSDDASIFDIPPGLLNPKNWSNAYFDLDENTTYVLSKKVNEVSEFTHKYWLSRVFVDNGIVGKLN